MPCLADSGYEGGGTGILVPVKTSGNQEPGVAARTRAARLRGRGERGFALLTGRWAALRPIAADPGRVTGTTRAALVLTRFEHKDIS